MKCSLRVKEFVSFISHEIWEIVLASLLIALSQWRDQESMATSH